MILKCMSEIGSQEHPPAYRVIVAMPSCTSEAVRRSISARPSPLRCQAGATDTSQMTAESAPSEVARAKPSSCGGRWEGGGGRVGSSW